MITENMKKVTDKRMEYDKSKKKEAQEPGQEIVWNVKGIWTVLKDQQELPRWLGTVQEKE